MRRRFLAPVLAIALATRVAAQAVTIEPEVALAAERIFAAMATEVVFCLHAEPTPYGGWHVRSVQLARQGTSADRDSASFDCAGANGFMHNHPREGMRWCRLSDTDRLTLERYAFAVLWCPAKRFTYEVRERALPAPSPAPSDPGPNP